MWKLRAMNSMSFTVFSYNATVLLIQPNPSHVLENATISAPSSSPATQKCNHRTYAIKYSYLLTLLLGNYEVCACRWDNDVNNCQPISNCRQSHHQTFMMLYQEQNIISMQDLYIFPGILQARAEWQPLCYQTCTMQSQWNKQSNIVSI